MFESNPGGRVLRRILHRRGNGEISQHDGAGGGRSVSCHSLVILVILFSLNSMQVQVLREWSRSEECLEFGFGEEIKLSPIEAQSLYTVFNRSPEDWEGGVLYLNSSRSFSSEQLAWTNMFKLLCVEPFRSCLSVHLCSHISTWHCAARLCPLP
jgi:hypothetical protein